MTERELRNLIETYHVNTEMVSNLNAKIEALDIKITACYGFNCSGSGFDSSKVEQYIEKKEQLRQRLDDLQRKIVVVDIVVQILTKEERQVIEAMKIYQSKLNRMAKFLHKSRKYVFDTREKSLKKMCDYLEGVFK